MAQDPNFPKVQQIISNILNVPADSITPESSTKTVEAWDSMGHLMLILELEQEFDKQFPPEQVEKMTDVAAILKVVDE